MRSIEEVLEYLQRLLAYARKAMTSLTTKNHLDAVTIYFGPMAKADVAAGVACLLGSESSDSFRL